MNTSTASSEQKIVLQHTPKSTNVNHILHNTQPKHNKQTKIKTTVHLIQYQLLTSEKCTNKLRKILLYIFKIPIPDLY